MTPEPEPAIVFRMEITDPRAAEFGATWCPSATPEGTYAHMWSCVIPVTRLQVGDTFWLRSGIAGVVESIELTSTGKSVRIGIGNGIQRGYPHTETCTPVTARATLFLGYEKV